MGHDVKERLGGVGVKPEHHNYVNFPGIVWTSPLIGFTVDLNLPLGIGDLDYLLPKYR